jgi:signal transduction histidine kinase
VSNRSEAGQELRPQPRQSPPSRYVFATTDWAFLVVTLAAYLSILVQTTVYFTPAIHVLLLGLLTLYTVIGTYSFETYFSFASPGVRALYFAIQLLLSTGILLLGRLGGALWLIWLPLLCHSVVLLKRAGVIVICGIVLTLFGALVGMSAGWQTGISAALSFAPGAIFVIIFTEVTLNESRARIEVERLARDLRAAHDDLARYAVQVEELATEKERTRLAREIHDSLGHYLTAINVQLEAARALQADAASPAAGLLERAQALAKEGLQEVRRAVAALRVSPLEGRSLPALLDELVQACRAAGVETVLEVQGRPRPLAPPAEMALYRAAQEALTNVRKHAHARHAAVTLSYTPDVVRLRVQDDGLGSAAPAGGFGLVGLRERMQLLGGALTTLSAPGEGFMLEVVLP